MPFDLEIKATENLLEKYPAFQSLHLINAAILKKNNSEIKEEKLIKIASKILDRTILYSIVHEDKISFLDTTTINKPIEKTDEPIKEEKEQILSEENLEFADNKIVKNVKDLEEKALIKENIKEESSLFLDTIEESDNYALEIKEAVVINYKKEEKKKKKSYNFNSLNKQSTENEEKSFKPTKKEKSQNVSTTDKAFEEKLTKIREEIALKKKKRDEVYSKLKNDFLKIKSKEKEEIKIIPIKKDKVSLEDKQEKNINFNRNKVETIFPKTKENSITENKLNHKEKEFVEPSSEKATTSEKTALQKLSNELFNEKILNKNKDLSEKETRRIEAMKKLQEELFAKTPKSDQKLTIENKKENKLQENLTIVDKLRKEIDEKNSNKELENISNSINTDRNKSNNIDFLETKKENNLNLTSKSIDVNKNNTEGLKNKSKKFKVNDLYFENLKKKAETKSKISFDEKKKALDEIKAKKLIEKIHKKQKLLIEENTKINDLAKRIAKYKEAQKKKEELIKKTPSNKEELKVTPSKISIPATDKKDVPKKSIEKKNSIKQNNLEKEETSQRAKNEVNFLNWLKRKKEKEENEIKIAKNIAKHEEIPFERVSVIEAEMHNEIKQSNDPLDDFISLQIARKKTIKNKTKRQKNIITKNTKNEIITETFAKILIAQQNFIKAIEVYNALKVKNPEKSLYFARQIEKIKTYL